MADQIRYVDIAKLDLKPGDRLVVKVQGHISEEGEATIKAEIARFAPGVPVLVIEGGVDLAVLSESEVEV